MGLFEWSSQLSVVRCGTSDWNMEIFYLDCLLSALEEWVLFLGHLALRAFGRKTFEGADSKCL